MKNHIIFDFDGVIADTFDVNWALTQKHAIEPTLEDFLAHHDGNVYEEPKLRFHDEAIHLFFSEYRERMLPSHVAVAEPYIRALAETYTLHIVSSNAEDVMTTILEVTDLRNCFTSVLGRETDRSKVAKFRMIFDAYNVPASDVLFVTDTLGDIREANTVGMKTIAETFGFHSAERLALGNPYSIVANWDELTETVKKIFV